MDHQGGTPERYRYRRVATSLFGPTWDLVEQAGPSAEEDAEMLRSAATSWFAWPWWE
jgi:hypothetical protein